MSGSFSKVMKMKNNKSYYISGGILCLIAFIFAAVSFTHPELSFPWPNRVSYIIYTLYLIYTVLVFCMPKFRNSSLASCGFAAAQFTALALIVIYIGTKGTPNESIRYLISGLVLTCVADFTGLAWRKRKNR